MKRLKKYDRLKVYQKYNGHCAYCGKEIDFKDMQVDHMIPVGTYEEIPEEKIWCMENYMPACRLCNHYKRADSLDAFRLKIERIPLKLERDNYIFRVGMQYGNVSKNDTPIEFYFEKEDKK